MNRALLPSNQSAQNRPHPGPTSKPGFTTSAKPAPERAVVVCLMTVINPHHPDWATKASAPKSRHNCHSPSNKTVASRPTGHNQGRTASETHANHHPTIDRPKTRKKALVNPRLRIREAPWKRQIWKRSVGPRKAEQIRRRPQNPFQGTIS